MFAYLQMRRQRIVRTGELTGPLKLSRTQEAGVFSRMTRGGIIARVRRGLYLVPERLPLGGAWSPPEPLALNTLMADREGLYQICGPNAFNLHGLDQQVPARVWAYNNRISGQRTIGVVELNLIKVGDERLGGTKSVVSTDGETSVYSSRVRTLVDAVYDWSRFNSLPRAYAWIRAELEGERVTVAELVAATLRWGDRGTVRRIGYLLERLGAPASSLKLLARALPVSTGLIPWNPAAPKRGTASRKWGVVVNDPF